MRVHGYDRNTAEYSRTAQLLIDVVQCVNIEKNKHTLKGT